jgi:hypothetical protein
MDEVDDVYWYINRDKLECGQIFRTFEGVTVRLVRSVPGDATQWYADTWHNGWCCEDFTLEPGDLRTMPLDEPVKK